MEFVLYEKKNHTAVITMNRPKALNAVNSRMLEEMTEALLRAEEDHEIRCVILTGAGDRAFTAGGDIKEEALLTPETADSFSRRGKRLILLMLDHRVPVICAVRGHALGGGMEMILAGDITVAASDAKIGIPTVKLGGIPGWGSTVLLPAAVGLSRAKELLYTGRSLTAKEALDLGVVEYVTEPEKLMETAMGLADTIAGMAPMAIESMKKSVNKAFCVGVKEGLEKETRLFAACFGTEDHKKATAAFLEKRSH